VAACLHPRCAPAVVACLHPRRARSPVQLHVHHLGCWQPCSLLRRCLVSGPHYRCVLKQVWVGALATAHLNALWLILLCTSAILLFQLAVEIWVRVLNLQCHSSLRYTCDWPHAPQTDIHVVDSMLDANLLSSYWTATDHLVLVPATGYIYQATCFEVSQVHQILERKVRFVLEHALQVACSRASAASCLFKGTCSLTHAQTC
jgi:hypothetical protein